MDRDTTLTIVGSGLAGTLLACHLGQAGHRVVLYERRADPRAASAERGRSINLALSTRGLHALGEVGLAEEVLRQSVVMRGRMIHSREGKLTYQPYGKDDNEVLHSVSRAGLNRVLVEAAARYPNVEMHFGHRCVSADIDRGRLEFDNGVTASAEVIVGADGAFSAVRQAMQRRERFDYSQEYLSHGYKELEIAPGADGAFRMEKNALHIWPRGGFMLIALPNLGGSFTCTLFAAHEGANSFEALGKYRDVLEFFQHNFPDAVPLLPDLVAQFRQNPVGQLVTIRCRPWHVGGQAVLLGDAAHAVVPFLGQGMNAAFEDCSVLTACLERSGLFGPDARARVSSEPDALAMGFRALARKSGSPTTLACASGSHARAFAEYEALRKPNLDVLARLCLDNFVEMRDKVGSRWFVLKKKLSLLLHRLVPGVYVPLYTLVEFTRVPYAEAEDQVNRSQVVLQAVVITLFWGFLILLAARGAWSFWKG